MNHQLDNKDRFIYNRVSSGMTEWSQRGATSLNLAYHIGIILFLCGFYNILIYQPFIGRSRSITPSYPLAYGDRSIRCLRTHHVDELRLRYNVGLHSVPDESPLFECISIADQISFAPCSTDEAEAESRKSIVSE